MGCSNLRQLQSRPTRRSEMPVCLPGTHTGDRAPQKIDDLRAWAIRSAAVFERKGRADCDCAARRCVRSGGAGGRVLVDSGGTGQSEPEPAPRCVEPGLLPAPGTVEVRGRSNRFPLGQAVLLSAESDGGARHDDLSVGAGRRICAEVQNSSSSIGSA